MSIRQVLRSGVVVGALSLVALGAPADARADLQVQPGQQFVMLHTPVPVSCSNTGSIQDVAKTPILKNTTGATIHKGTLITWKSSDGDNGSLTLDAPLAPGAWVEGHGHPGQNYTCTASFLANADLTVKSAAWGSTVNEVVVEVHNASPWVDAGPFVTKVEVINACTSQVLATVHTAAMPLARNTTSKITVAVPTTTGKRYLRVTTDAGNQVIESNEQNNMLQTFYPCVS